MIEPNFWRRHICQNQGKISPKNLYFGGEEVGDDFVSSLEAVLSPPWRRFCLLLFFGCSISPPDRLMPSPTSSSVVGSQFNQSLEQMTLPNSHSDFDIWTQFQPEFGTSNPAKQFSTLTFWHSVYHIHSYYKKNAYPHTYTYIICISLTFVQACLSGCQVKADTPYPNMGSVDFNIFNLIDK